jgi:hypothetical protein
MCAGKGWASFWFHLEGISFCAWVVFHHRCSRPVPISWRHRMMPRQDSVWLAGVQAADVYRGHLGCWAGQAIRSRHVGCAPAADQLCQRMLGHRRSALSRTRCLATLDYMTLKHTDLDATVSWTVDYTSQGHGIVLWFDSVLAEDIALTNRPGAPRLIYRQSFLPWPSPLDLCSGDTVTVTVGALQNQRPLERC